MVPLFRSKQLIFVVVAAMFSAGGSVTIIVASAVQLCESVTRTVIVPPPASVTATEVPEDVRVAPAVFTSVLNA